MSDDNSWDSDIPSLDDIIPWSGGNKRKGRFTEVLDPVRKIQGLNEIFLENALKSYFISEGVDRDVRVESHFYSPMDTPDNSQRNDLLEVNVNATVDGTLDTFHMVIKMLTPSQPVRTLSAMYSFDRREVGFYSEILDNLNVFQRQQLPNANEYVMVPSSKCFFARYTAPSGETDSDRDYNISTDESVVVLENVKYQGFTHTLIEEGLSKDQVLTVIEGVSRLHGISLAMKERSGIPLKRSYPYLLCLEHATMCIESLFDKKVAEVRRLLESFGASHIVRKLMNLRPHLGELVEALGTPEEPMTILSHMNLWAHNILFRDDECVFVDWQMITCTRPTFDVAFLLATSVRSNIRRRYLKTFLEHYYQNFRAHALKYGLDIVRDLDYTRERLRRDFRYTQLLALFFYIGKFEALVTTRETELQLIDYLNDLYEQNILSPDIMDSDEEEDDNSGPENRGRSNLVMRSGRRNSTDDVDHICGLFPVYELPED